jgi:hypothetical protein
MTAMFNRALSNNQIKLIMEGMTSAGEGSVSQRPCVTCLTGFLSWVPGSTPPHMTYWKNSGCRCGEPDESAGRWSVGQDTLNAIWALRSLIYYWRVDEVNACLTTIFKGEARQWSRWALRLARASRLPHRAQQRR